MKSNVARFKMLQFGPHYCVKPWQCMKRYRRKTVMLGVKRHIPGQPTHRPECQQCAGVCQHVTGPFIAPSMLGQQIGAKKGLADKSGQDKTGP